MKRIGKAAARVVDQLTLDEQFRDADGRDQDQQAEVLARMRSAVDAAAEAAGERLAEARRFRLACCLKHLWFCGATKRDGSRIRLEKLAGKLRVSRRTVCYDLDLLRAWGLVVTRQTLRGAAHRLAESWIAELVSARKVCTVERKRGANLALLSANSALALLKSCTVQPAFLHSENNSASKSAIKREPPEAAGLTWPELAELLGESDEGLEGVLRAKLSEFSYGRAMGYRRRSEPIPDYVLTPLWETCNEHEN